MGTGNRLARAAVAAMLLTFLIVPSITAAPARPLVRAPAPASIGSNSCSGIGACDGATGNIGNNSCNGNAACATSTVNVGDNSCNGYYACYEDHGSIGNDSCNGEGACYLWPYPTLSIGIHSCNGKQACSTPHVGGYSCNGDESCRFVSSTTTVGDCQMNTVAQEPCNPCPAGFHSANGIGYPTGCVPADPGHFVDTTGATTQAACNPGYYQPNSGQTSCSPTSVGFYVDTTGADHQTACPAGQTTASTASTSISACFTPYVSPYARKQNAVAELQALLPTGSAEANNRLNKAIAKINASLETWRWIDANSLNPVFGWRVFNAERHAITWLWAGPILSNPTFSAVANDAVNQMVAADREIVVKAIAGSTDSVAIAIANAKLAQADALLAQQQRSKAIYKLRAAWLAVN